MLDCYAKLTLEPWCYTPGDIARLTDWQILHLYFEPARKLAEEMERKSKGGSAGPGAVGGARPADPKTGEVGNPGSPGHRKAMLEVMTKVIGMSPKVAEAQYERQLKAFREKQGKG